MQNVAMTEATPLTTAVQDKQKKLNTQQTILLSKS